MSVLPRASSPTPTSSRSFHTWECRIRNNEVYRHGYNAVANRTDVRFLHKADIATGSTDVRFRGQSGHHANLRECPLMTQSRHSVPTIVATQNDNGTPFRQS